MYVADVCGEMNKEIPFKVADYDLSCPECHKEFKCDLVVNIGDIDPEDYGYSQVDTLQTCIECGYEFQQDVDVTTVKEDFQI